jgi:hypothetical protein
VDYLAPYRHISDGFYEWECGQCKDLHGDRGGWALSGQVLRCEKCGHMNLLVRTNCIAIDEAISGMWQSAEQADENKRLKDIQRFNIEHVVAIKRDVLSAVRSALDAVDPHVTSTGKLPTRV